MVERDIFEVANQLEGYVDEGTPQALANFLLREGLEAAKLADTIVTQSARIAALEAQLAEAKGKLNEIACWSQSQSLLWWQVTAREALSALEATPPAPKVTEAMVEALKEARSVIYDTQQSCLYDDDDGQVGVTEDAVISPYHFQKICNSLKVIDDALTAAQEAGKP